MIRESQHCCPQVAFVPSPDAHNVRGGLFDLLSRSSLLEVCQAVKLDLSESQAATCSVRALFRCPPTSGHQLRRRPLSRFFPFPPSDSGAHLAFFLFLRRMLSFPFSPVGCRRATDSHSHRAQTRQAQRLSTFETVATRGYKWRHKANGYRKRTVLPCTKQTWET
jgi:hypothetical protein